MSVTESCASRLPSTNSTMEWIGALRMHDHLTCSGGMSKSRQASITSKPLFISVAESMVMRRPIFQVGWFSACSTVMLANSAARGVQERPAGGGQPDALNFVRRPPRMHW